ncbi:hypothetical protein [Flavobacterium pokkalii]|uniref:hypothetical protein n=1 Tax=Flavobacterium pokkalii TaxID=1940408 RepID=UPI0016611D74|nr:hypothetical protein [Flavobacterium pokkalii]
MKKNIVRHMVNHGLENYTNHQKPKLPFTNNWQIIKFRLPALASLPYLGIEAKAGAAIFIKIDNSSC